MMRRLLLFCFLLPFLPLLSQTEGQKDIVTKKYIQIKGIIKDKQKMDPVAYATVRMFNQADSVYVQGGITDADGLFKLYVSPGKYNIEISFLGYKSITIAKTIDDKEKVCDIGEVILQEDTFQLKAAVVVAKAPDILVRGDTIEYNASAYSSDESDLLQDIVKRMPGVELDANGNLTANGKPIRKILVDGKEFFGNDMVMALNNLPANMIKKLQLFKEESETAKVTGIKDKEPNQVLNLVVKDELKQSVFGNAKGGYGTDDRYAANALVNYMRNENQASLILDVNNVNGNSVQSYGLEKNETAGINIYSQSNEKLKIGGNVRYGDNENKSENESNTQTFLNTGDRFSTQNSYSVTDRKNLNGGMNLNWTPDSLTNIYARTSVNFTKAKNNSYSTQRSYVEQNDTTSGFTDNKNNSNGFAISNSLNIGRRLNDKGRNISLTVNQSYRDDTGDGTNYSETDYSASTPKKIIDQLMNTKSYTNSLGGSVSYVEPTGKDNRIQFSYGYNWSKSERDRDTRRKDDKGLYTVIDSAYTRDSKNTYINQNIGLTFQSSKEKYNYTVGFSIDPSYSGSQINLGDSIIENVKQNVVNYSPTIQFSFTPNPQTSFDFNYSGSTSQPSINQLSADTVILNALSKQYGNPNLKPSYNNNLYTYFQKSDFEKNRFFMISAGFNYIINSIVGYTDIDKQGNTSNTYRNVNGNMGANIGVIYTTPLKNKKLTFNTNSYAYFSRNVGFTNGEKTITNNWVLNQQVMVKYMVPKFETSLQLKINHNIARNNLGAEQNQSTTDYGFVHYILVRLPLDFSIQNDIDYTRYAGYEANFKKSQFMWNASIDKKFLKGKKGTFSLQFFDILNDRNNLSRIVTSNYVSDSRTNSIGRFCMLTFSYRFNIFNGKKTNDIEVDSDYIYY